MRIRKVHLHNFKVYRGHNDIDCTIDSSAQKPLVIIGGPNGSGKTSFLESLKLCLFGSQNKLLLSPFGGNYQRYLKEVHNKSAKLEHEPFSITLEYSDDRIRDIDIFSIRRSWKLNKDNRYDEELELLANGSLRDDIDKTDFQLEINEHFPFGVSELLLFDSEEFNKIPDFLENGFISSLNKFMGIDIYNQLNKDLANVKKIQISQDDQQIGLELDENEAKMSTLNEKHQNLEQKKTIAQKERKAISSRIEHLKVTLQKQSGDISLTHRELDNEAMEINQRSKNLSEENRRVYSDIKPFSLTQNLCDSLISTLNAEKKYKNNKVVQGRIRALGNRFFEKVEEKVDKNTIRTLIEVWKELDNENVKRTKLIHDISESKTIEINNILNSIKKSSKKQIDNIKTEKKRIRTDYHNLNKKRRRFNPEGPGAKTYEKINDLTTQLGQLIEREKSFDEKLKDSEKQIINQQKQLKIIFNKSEKSAKRTEKSNLIDRSLNLLDNFAIALTEARFTKLKVVFLETYTALSTKSDKISELHFNQFDKKLEFLDDKGKKLGMKDFSAGESEIATFSLLWAVNETAETRYPIVTDSPFNRLDTKHRNNFINKILKKSKSQIIFLSTNEEISNIDNFGLRDYVESTYMIKHSSKNKSSKFVSDYFQS